MRGALRSPGLYWFPTSCPQTERDGLEHEVLAGEPGLVIGPGVIPRSSAHSFVHGGDHEDRRSSLNLDLRSRFGRQLRAWCKPVSIDGRPAPELTKKSRIDDAPFLAALAGSHCPKVLNSLCVCLELQRLPLWAWRAKMHKVCANRPICGLRHEFGRQVT
jgi:hypothetical protein